ncbi:hypothetical protein [Saccharothrix variisporea]|uniref:Uncharacterized protein n=1 Tax=Saccharothrix variisporea TaxID=543527 RepID=A0A495X1H9_9PSEU|nr:hypothetical protein [Saccharothrix variisporea]RKT67707.1 hypothetical protein DFJ66_0883 [Saccharothrix variisporea]
MIDLDAHLGRRVTLRGTAHDAHAGAVLVPEGGEPPVYVEHLAAWGADAGRDVRVTGVLRLVPPTTRPRPVSHGLTGAVYVLTDPVVER